MSLSTSRTEDLDEILAKLLAANPAAMKELFAKFKDQEPSISTPKVKSFSRPSKTSDYILQTRNLCLLCGSISIEHHRISWDSARGIYTHLFVPPNLVPETLDLKFQNQESIKCSCCVTILKQQSIEDLVARILSETDPTTLEYRENILRKNFRKEFRL